MVFVLPNAKVLIVEISVSTAVVLLTSHRNGHLVNQIATKRNVNRAFAGGNHHGCPVDLSPNLMVGFEQFRSGSHGYVSIRLTVVLLSLYVIDACSGNDHNIVCGSVTPTIQILSLPGSNLWKIRMNSGFHFSPTVGQTIDSIYLFF